VTAPQDQHPKRLPTFAYRGSRSLSDRQKRLVSELLPRVSVPDAGPGSLDPSSLFDAEQDEIWLEIGFGGAEHLLGQAKANPGIGLIGCEPFVDGVAKALAGIESAGLVNVRLHRGDGRDVMDRLAPQTIDRCFILFPDPWPKTRHHKRRLIQAGFLDDLERLLKPGAWLRVATDVADYADWAMERLWAHPGFDWRAGSAADWREPPADHIPTRYQAKGLGDIAPVYLDFFRSRD